MDAPTKCGQIGYEKFDNVFFGIAQKLSHNTEPSAKLGYLRSFEAILDAGEKN